MEKNNHSTEIFRKPEIEQLDDFTEGKYDKNTEHITSSAININGQLFTGKRHGDCFLKAREELGMIKILQEDQGFITNKGHFVNREEAARIAFNAKQTTRLEGKLFSEDLW